jgi:hypothetical protein
MSISLAGHWFNRRRPANSTDAGVDSFTPPLNPVFGSFYDVSQGPVGMGLVAGSVGIGLIDYASHKGSKLVEKAG